jgi:hypothetical protein
MIKILRVEPFAEESIDAKLRLTILLLTSHGSASNVVRKIVSRLDDG